MTDHVDWRTVPRHEAEAAHPTGTDWCSRCGRSFVVGVDGATLGLCPGHAVRNRCDLTPEWCRLLHKQERHFIIVQRLDEVPRLR